MEDFGGFCPVRIRYLSIGELRERLLGFPEGDCVGLFLDAALTGLFSFQDVIAAMKARYRLALVDAIPSDPTQEDIRAALELLGGKRPDWLIAIGGGSAMDLAKAVNALRTPLGGQAPRAEAITRLLVEKTYRGAKKEAGMIFVPTTAGTGSEMTRWATVWDAGKRAKYSVEDADLYAREVFLVPELTRYMPKRLTLSTGLDSLCHAMEAFWAKSTNPVVQEIAALAARRIRDNLPMALAEPMDLNFRGHMSVAAALAGIAFSNTRTTACHSISYPITMRFHVEHGFACALTLAEVARRNSAAMPALRELLQELFGGADGLRGWLEAVCRGVQPLTLSALGIGEKDVAPLAQASFTAGRMDNNPIPFGIGDVADILYTCR